MTQHGNGETKLHILFNTGTTFLDTGKIRDPHVYVDMAIRAGLTTKKGLANRLGIQPHQLDSALHKRGQLGPVVEVIVSEAKKRLTPA